MHHFKKHLGGLEKILSSRIIIILFYLLLFLFIFSFNYVLPRDPDLGWHLRYGEEIVLNKKISTEDTFSHTFRGQSMVDNQWLTEVVFYSLFSRWSFFGLALFSAFFTSLAFFIPALCFSGSLPNKFLITSWAVLGSFLVLGNGARPQNVSLVFFSLLLVSLFKYRQTQKLRYLIFLPLMFLIWVNSHPGFVIGLFLLLTFLLIELLFSLLEIVNSRRFQVNKKQWTKRSLFSIVKTKKAKNLAPLLIVFLLSLFLSGFRLQSYQSQEEGFSLTLVKTLALPVSMVSEDAYHGSVRTKISEWLPPILTDLPGTLFFLGIIFSTAVFLLKPIAKDDLKNLILLFGLIYFSTLSRRNVPFFFLFFMPVVINKTEKLISQSGIKKILPYLGLVVILIMVFVVAFRIPKTTRNIFEGGASITTYCEARRYPCEAIEFIKKERLEGKMFNHYNLGGFLIWQLREYPVFIDGRVPGKEIFFEYEKVAGLKKDWEEILEKYEVKWIITAPNRFFEGIIRTEGNWEQVYKDERAIILVKKEKSENGY